LYSVTQIGYGAKRLVFFMQVMESEMYLKIVIELVLAVALQMTGSAFWSCVKSLKFRQSILADPEAIKKILSTVDKDQFRQESKKIQPIGKTYADNIDLVLSTGGKLQNKTRNILLIPIVAIFIGSNYLGESFVILNSCLFFVLSWFRISATVQKNVFSDVLGVCLNINKWNSVNAEECEKFCNQERPVFKYAYKVVSEF
jgi:hypothetical protein